MRRLNEDGLAAGGLAAHVDRQLDEMCGDAGSVAIAVSGGGDSTALLLLAREWAAARGRGLIALTVDHGYRRSAAGEAREVARLCDRLGTEHETLTLSGLRPAMAHGREARYEALSIAARRRGVRHLLLGHTFDDQIETFLIRVRQHSRWLGLGGMDRLAPSPAWPAGRGVRLVRPLLLASRDELRAWLHAQGEAWIEDPTNMDPRHERVRMRALLRSDSDLNARVSRAFLRLAALRRAELRLRADILERQCRALEDGSLEFERGDMGWDRFTELCGWLVQFAAGHARYTRVPDIALPRPDPDGPSATTWRGAWILRSGEAWHVLRDPGACDTSGTLRHGVWDGRFIPGGGQHPQPGIPGAARGLPPPGPGWRALAPARLAEICDIWRHL